MTNRRHKSIRVDIDYDKLAKAIVKAQRQADKQLQLKTEQQELLTTRSEEKQSFWKIAWNIIWNKGDSEGRLLTGSFVTVLSVLFRMIAIMGVVLDVIMLYEIVVYCMKASWNYWGQVVANVVAGVIFILIVVLIALFSLMIKGAGNDIEKEKDKNYVVAVFSAIVGLVALIVAVIALAKEVV